MDPLEDAQGHGEDGTFDDLPAETSSEAFRFCWNNHSSEVFANIRSLQTNEALSDVTIICPNAKSSNSSPVFFKAHKIILASSSFFFEHVLTTLVLSGNGPCLNLVMTDIEPAILKLVLKFVYEGEVDVESGQMSKFMAACKKLDLRGLSIDDYLDGVEEGEFMQDVPVDPLSVEVSASKQKSQAKQAKKRGAGEPVRSDHGYFTKSVPQPPKKRGRKKSLPEFGAVPSTSSQTHAGSSTAVNVVSTKASLNLNLKRCDEAKKPRVYQSKHPVIEDAAQYEEMDQNHYVDENVNYELAEVKTQPQELIIDDDYGSLVEGEQGRVETVGNLLKGITARKIL